MNDELDEKQESSSRLITEFDRFKESKDTEIQDLLTKLDASKENCSALRAQIQHEVKTLKLIEYFLGPDEGLVERTSRLRLG